MYKRPVINLDTGESEIPKVTIQPKRARRIGAVMMALSLPLIAPATDGLEYASTVTGNAIVDGVSGTIDSVVDGLQSLSRGGR